jgi:flagellar capping protein FliD
MSVKPVASYWSATADIGREPIAARGGAVASYWSATANVGRSDTVSLSDTVTEATYYNRKGTPYVTNRGEAGSAYRTQQTIADLDKFRTRSPISRKLSIGDSRAIGGQEDFFTRLTGSLMNLSERLKSISTTGAFNPNIVTSSSPDVSAQTSINAEARAYEVTVERLSQSHQIASDAQSDPYGTVLNLSGTVSINGYAITVETTDTVADIKDKINYGEDNNKNGTLEDFSEDLNSNGILDHYYQPAIYVGGGTYLPSFNYFEDIDANNIIDSSEDINGNGFLDGGTAQIKAKASIEDNRLIITSLDTTDKKLSIYDPDDILDSLGFFKRGDHNERVLKTSADNDEYESVEYRKDPKSALLTVNGVSYAANSDNVDGIIPGVTLILKSVTDNEVEIKISKDATQVIDRITAFSSAYNKVVTEINDQNRNHLQIQDNVRVQDFIIALARSAHAEVGSLASKPNSLNGIGVEVSGSDRKGLDVAAIEGLLSGNGYKGLINTDGGEPGLFNRLSRVGILSRDDFTLEMDKHKLSAEIEKNPQQVYSVFNNHPDGVSKKLERDIEYATNKSFGMIKFQTSVLRHFGSSPADASGIMARSAAVDYPETRVDGSISIFESIKA